MKKLLFVLVLFLCSCVPLEKIGFNDSEKAIKNEIKSFTVLGNLRVVIERGEDLYDKIMKAAIAKYGDRIDIINLKEDENYSSNTYGGDKVINCLVIRYE